MNLIEDGSVAFLQEAIDELPEYIQLQELIDHNGYTVVHKACRLDEGKCFDVLIKSAAKTMDKHAMRDWLNIQTTSEKLTALHFASSAGNIPMC